jgi:Flp pilus assembly protein TadG
MPPCRKKFGKNKIARFTKRSGQSLIETLAGMIFLIPLALFSYDLTYIIIASESNERLAENAARSAANNPTSLAAQKAAQQAVDNFNDNSNKNHVILESFIFDDNGQVSLITQMQIALPVPLASWSQVTTSAHAVVPIVAYPAPM